MDQSQFISSSKKVKKTPKRSTLRAHTSKQILHMDVTIFRPSDHSRVYIYLILDNFSRAIMGWKVLLEGAIPDKNRFKAQTTIAIQERKLANKQQICCIL